MTKTKMVASLSALGAAILLPIVAGAGCPLPTAPPPPPAIASIALSGSTFTAGANATVTVQLTAAPAAGSPATVSVASGAFASSPVSVVITNPESSGSASVTLANPGSWTADASAVSGSTGSAISATFTVAAPTVAATLTLSLDSALDGDGDVKATSITSAELLNSSSTVVATATISGSSAVFGLTGLTAGDYFIRVNNLDDDLVPTHIDDPTTSITQFTGQKLRASVIGSESDATYRIQTFSKGQGEHPFVKYSDGTDVSPTEYPYALVSRKTAPPKLSLRVLGTGTEVNSFSPSFSAPPDYKHPCPTPITFNQPFADWVLHVQSTLHHPDAWNNVDTNCTICHINLDTKATAFSSIATTTGWCYRCHYGKTGDENGFVDPTK